MAISTSVIVAFLWANRKQILAIMFRTPELIQAASDLKKADGSPEDGAAKRAHVFEILRAMTPEEVPDSFINFVIELALSIMRWRGKKV